MKIQNSKIDDALKYYKIDDIDYIQKCYKCIKKINTINNLNLKTEEIYNILYGDEKIKINTLWKKQSMIELFGEEYNPFVTNILVLLGYKIHDENMEKKNYNNEQKGLYKKRVRETLTNDIFIRKLDGIRISQMIWGAYFINTKLIEVGRLQYEDCKDYIKIHIPSGSKLLIEKVIDSINNSKKEIEKYFDIKNPTYICDSWLLSNQINAIIDLNSNIRRFYNLFDVEDGEDATKNILNFVFNVQECENFSNLSENTSLQRLLKKQLLENKEMRIGVGKLKII